MARIQYIEVPDGFELIKTEKAVSTEKARSILCTRKKRNIASAKYEGDYIVLTQYHYRCPYCRRLSLAYFREVGKPKQVTKTEINQWISDQYAIHDHKPSLILNNPIVSTQNFYCSYCRQVSTPYHHNQKIIVERERKKIKVSMVARSMAEYLEQREMEKDWARAMSFPVTETLTFNLGNGHVYHYIREKDILTGVNDLRSEREFSKDSVLCQAIIKYDLVRREMMKLFRSIYGTILPYTNKELCLENFFKMTRFVGYQKNFYENGVPYDLENAWIDRSFKTAVKRLHFAKDLPGIYERSGLPQTKSIRRLFFNQPGYFFFLKEAELLWNLLDNVNYFRSMLQLSHAFDILSFLHDYPATILFFQSFKDQRTVSLLCFQIESNWCFLQSYALQFSCQSYQRRIVEMETWQKRWRPDLRRGRRYSIPICIVTPTIRECKLDGFEFVWLKTRADYVQAGNELNNCLADWDSTNNTIMVMKKNGQCKAAIEIQNGQIRQAYAEDNYPIEDDIEVLGAYDHWRRLNHIPKYMEDEYF